jgi:hypothetical protein
MLLLYHSDRCNTSETVFHWCYVNDLHTTHAVVCWVTTIGPRPGRATLSHLFLERPMPTVLISYWQAWPKNPYIKTRQGVSWFGGGETRNYETKAEPDWRGEMLPGPSPIASPTSPTSPTPPPWWRGSSPPLDYRFVAVAWSFSLLCYVD